ncbi:MAG TPA: 7-carboxy-7-deazaguanine synthase QueE [Elusimicrobiales bacterium]|nr:7-carboxy-7-deazaguanine synthase QueE [Elusimicrobiales bacterium]
MTKQITAPIYEIFSSFQGEGIYAGQRHIFIRFCGCNLSCSYCDEPASKAKVKSIAVRDIIVKVKAILKKENIKVVSLTGGEPLCHSDFLKNLICHLKKLHLKIYLETNACKPDEFKKIAGVTDIVSADIKLPSDAGQACWSDIGKFLKLCKNKVFVKIVLTDKSKFSECVRAVKLIRSVSSKIPLVLQPVTVKRGVGKPSDKFIAKVLKFSQDIIMDVRVLPQMHHIWKVK